MKKIFIQLCFVLLLPSCGKQANPGASEAATKIAVIPKGTSHSFWKAVQAGALDAGEEFGVEILWDGPQTETEIDRQRAILENMVQQGVKGVAIAPLDEQGMARPIQYVIDSGMPVVIFDSNVKADGYLSFVATDNEVAGGLAGSRMAKKLEEAGKTKARLMMVQYAEGSGSTLRREKGFEDKATAAGHEIVARQFTDGTPEGALTVAINMFTGFVENGRLNIDGIFSSNESTSAGLLRALKRLESTGVSLEGLVVVGFDSSPELVEALEEGTFDALVVQNPRRMGYLSVEALVMHLRGESIVAQTDTGAELIIKDRLGEAEVKRLLGIE